MTETLRVVDVSSYQGSVVAWDQLAQQGVAGGIAKCTEGSGWADPTFARNWAAIKSAGLLRGLYTFTRYDLGTTAQQEADWLLGHLPPLDAGDVIIIDAETPTSGPGAYDAQVLEEAERIERATGTTPWLYTGRWYAQELGRLTHPELARLPLFDAAYGPQQPPSYSPWTRITCWQRTNCASYKGIGPCDESMFFGGAGDWKRLGYPAPTAPASPAPVMKHLQLDVAMHLRPEPRVDAMPLGALLPAGTKVVELPVLGGGAVEQQGWAHTRTSGDVAGWLLLSNCHSYVP